MDAEKAAQDLANQAQELNMGYGSDKCQCGREFPAIYQIGNLKGDILPKRCLKCFEEITDNLNASLAEQRIL